MLERIENTIMHRKSLGKLRGLLKTYEGRTPMVDFSSNDYLGLTRNKKLQQNISQSYKHYLSTLPPHSPVIGSSGSRLLTGDNTMYSQTERFLADFHQHPYALLSNSGWDLNFGLLSSVPIENTWVIYDELCHNSIMIGLKYGRQKIKTKFNHNNLDHLESILSSSCIPTTTTTTTTYTTDSTTNITTMKNNWSGNSLYQLINQQSSESHKINNNTDNYHNNSKVFSPSSTANTDSIREKLIVVESVYSMDGDICDLERLLNLAHTYQAHVLVDEAHSTGIYGTRGEGLIASLGLQTHPALLGVVHTFGKAIGVHGAALLTSHESLITYLLNYSYPLIYSTSLPLHTLISIQEAYKMTSFYIEERNYLFDLIRHFQYTCHSLHIPNIMPSSSPIQGIIIPGNDLVCRMASYLQQYGYDCRPIRAPTVEQGKERIRIIIHAHNTKEEVTELCHLIHTFIQTTESKE